MNISDSPPKPMTTEERAEKLAYVLRSDTAGGWRVISQTPTSAQLEKGKDTSHLLHFLLGFPTLGLWWITVWPAVTILAGKKSRYVAIDEYGNVTRT